MSVQVEVSKYQDVPVSYALILTNPLAIGSLPAIEKNDTGIFVNLNPDDAQELHELLGTELGCTDCPCFDEGFDRGKDFERS